MALLATAAGIGIAAAAGGIAATVRANKKQAKPRGVTYGGSQEKKDALEQSYLKGVDQGNAQQLHGQAGLDKTIKTANGIGGDALTMMQGAQRMRAMEVGNRGGAILDQYKPGAVAAAQAQQALDQNTAASFGAARSGGALGLRNALNANANQGAQNAQAMAVQRAQEEQAYTGAQVAQANQNQQDVFQADQQNANQKAQLLAIGADLRKAGNQQAIQASSTQTSAGLANQGQFLDQEQNLNDQQAALSLAYEQQRMAAAQAKADRLGNMGSALIGGGLGMAGGAMRGK